MVTEYACSACSLQFSVGWFHYHLFDSGYSSQTLHVCLSCGTQHAIEIAMRDRGPEVYKYRDVVLDNIVDPLRVPALRLIRKALNCTPAKAKWMLARLPVTLKRRLSRSDLDWWQQRNADFSISHEYPVVDTEPNPTDGPLKSDRLLGAAKQHTSSRNPKLAEATIAEPLSDDGCIDLSIQACSVCTAYR